MSSTTRSTLSAILGKAKVGGLVLAAMVLIAGTAEASTGVVFSRGDDSVATVDDEPVDDSGDDGTVVDDSDEDGTVEDDCATAEPTVEPTEPSVEPTEEPTTEPTVETTEPTVEPTEEPTTEPAEEPTGDVTEPAPDPTTTDDECEPPTEEPTEEPTTEPTEPTEDEAACADAKNHGAYVSWVAHTTPPGPGHGAAVSAAAHSDCGKPGSDDAADDQRAGGKDKRSSKVKDKVKAVPPGQAKKDDPSYSPGNSDHSGVSHGNSAGHSNAGGNGKGKDK